MFQNKKESDINRLCTSSFMFVCCHGDREVSTVRGIVSTLLPHKQPKKHTGSNLCMKHVTEKFSFISDLKQTARQVSEWTGRTPSTQHRGDHAHTRWRVEGVIEWRYWPSYLLQWKFVFANGRQGELVWADQDEVTGANGVGASGTRHDYTQEEIMKHKCVDKFIVIGSRKNKHSESDTQINTDDSPNGEKLPQMFCNQKLGAKFVFVSKN